MNILTVPSIKRDRTTILGLSWYVLTIWALGKLTLIMATTQLYFLFRFLRGTLLNTIILQIDILKFNFILGGCWLPIQVIILSILRHWILGFCWFSRCYALLVVNIRHTVHQWFVSASRDVWLLPWIVVVAFLLLLLTTGVLSRRFNLISFSNTFIRWRSDHMASFTLRSINASTKIVWSHFL